MENIIKYVDKKSLILNNFHKLGIDANELMVLLGIIEVKNYNLNPFPEDIVLFYTGDKKDITSAYNSLIKRNLIKYTDKELSLEPVFKKCIAGIDDNKSVEQEIENNLKIELDQKQKIIINDLLLSVNPSDIIGCIKQKDCPNDFDNFIKYIVENNKVKFGKAKLPINWINN